MKHDTNLMEHLSATRRTFMDRTGKAPGTLAMGRWDIRELAHLMAANLPGDITALDIVRGSMEETTISLLGADVKIDFRVGRMPGALWWHP